MHFRQQKDERCYITLKVHWGENHQHRDGEGGGRELEWGHSQEEFHFGTCHPFSPQSERHKQTPNRDPKCTLGCMQRAIIYSHRSCAHVNKVSLTTVNNQHFCLSLKNYNIFSRCLNTDIGLI